LSWSATKTFPTASTAMPKALVNCPSPVPDDPHVVTNAPQPVGTVVVVVLEMVVDEVVALVVVLVVTVVVLVVDADVPGSTTVPARPIAPGPGRSTTASTAAFPVGGMQKAAARRVGCGSPSLRSPPGEPASWMHRVAVCPKAPTCDWPGQKSPSLAVSVTVPVVSGARPTGSGAWKPGRPGRQSVLVMPAPVATQACPASGPTLSKLGVHVASHVPARHLGHGDTALPVR